MKPVRFHPEADREVAEAQDWYRERSEVAAQALALEIDQAIKTIVEAPERWAKTTRDERRFVLARFPYSILYRIRFDTVFIIALAHQRRRPRYWRDRT
jgi:plasmid stabilization system protein ParE